MENQKTNTSPVADGALLGQVVLLAEVQKLERPETTRRQWHPTVAEMACTRADVSWARATGHEPLHRKYVGIGFGKLPTLHADGRVRPGDIADIVPVGVMDCFCLETAGGHAVIAPGSQIVLTPQGPIRIDSLVMDQLIVVRSEFQRLPVQERPTRLTDGRRRGGGYEDGPGFPEGPDNPSYINGGWAQFQKIREELIGTLGACEECGTPGGRLELHHVNRDRSNNERSNLKLLCPSCHKRAEYALGRTRRGERGYAIEVDIVASLEFVGPMEVFAITAPQSVYGVSVGRIVLGVNRGPILPL